MSAYTHLLYHLVFGVKDRTCYIKEDELNRLHSYLAGIIKNLKGIPVIVNGMNDHVHILCYTPSVISISDFVKSLKGNSSHWMNETFRSNKPKLYWQEGYGIFTVSYDNLEIIKSYIFNQQEHHRKSDFTQEWQTIIEEITKWKTSINYDQND